MAMEEEEEAAVPGSQPMVYHRLAVAVSVVVVVVVATVTIMAK